MPTKIRKKKRSDISREDVARKFIAFHMDEKAKEMEVELDSKERGELLDGLLDSLVDGLETLVSGVSETFLSALSDDEDEDEDEED